MLIGILIIIALVAIVFTVVMLYKFPISPSDSLPYETPHRPYTPYSCGSIDEEPLDLNGRPLL